MGAHSAKTLNLREQETYEREIARLRAELALARKKLDSNQERLRLAQSAGQMGTWEWDPEGNISALSSELHHMFATNPESHEHEKVWSSRVHPEDWAMVQEQMRTGYEAGSMEFEYRYLHPRQGLRWFYCKGRRIAGESRMFGVALDVTERKQIEETRNRLAAIVQSSDDAIISKDLNGIVTSWNAGAERMFGYESEEMVGKPITTIIPPELHKDEDMILGKIRRGERIDHFETERVCKSGERIEVSLSISPVRDEHGRIVGAAKIARDIMERKKIEETLRLSEKLNAAGRLAATVAHEINNPLEAVTNLVYLAKKEAAHPGKIAEHLELAGRELDRVAHITRQTLGFYRDTSSPTTLSVNEVIEDLLLLYDKRLETRKIRVIRRYDGDFEINALPGEIRQALSNIVSNSIDAMPRGGSLSIHISNSTAWNDPEGGVRVTILDTGPGIAQRHRKDIFQPFFTTKKEVGTGLGLWVTRNIVEKNRGRIRVRTRTGEKTHGTAFSIFFPVVSGHKAAKRRLDVGQIVA